MRRIVGADGDGHDAGDDRHADARQVAALAEVVEIVVVEEQLRADVVRSRVHLGLEVVHFQEAVGRSRVTLGEAGDTYAEAARVGVGATMVEAADVGDQIGGVAKGVTRVVIGALIAGRVTGQGQDVADAGRGVTLEDLRDLVGRVAHAGQVRDGVQRRGGLDPHHQVVGQLSCRRHAAP